MKILDLLHDNSFAYGINNAGWVVGHFSNAGDSSTTAFLYHDGNIQPLGYFGDRKAEVAWDLNERGQVVGYGGNHAFLYSDGRDLDIGTLGGAFAVAWGMNERGWVVGNSGTPSGEIDPYVYRGEVGERTPPVRAGALPPEGPRPPGAAAGQATASCASGSAAKLTRYTRRARRRLSFPAKRRRRRKVRENAIHAPGTRARRTTSTFSALSKRPDDVFD